MTAMDRLPRESQRSHVVKESYYDPSWVAREYAKLWPRSWQMACRLEELEKVGDYGDL
jgi:hypothetical protein